MLTLLPVKILIFQLLILYKEDLIYHSFFLNFATHLKNI